MAATKGAFVCGESGHPKARRDGLVVRELPDELLIYDTETHEAHCLNETAAFVWKQCDGETASRRSPAVLSAATGTAMDEEVVWVALEDLWKQQLLEGEPAGADEATMSRSQALRRTGLVAAVVAVPAVISMSRQPRRTRQRASHRGRCALRASSVARIQRARTAGSARNGIDPDENARPGRLAGADCRRAPRRLAGATLRRPRCPLTNSPRSLPAARYGSGAVAWWRIRRSSVAGSQVGEQLRDAYRLHALQAAVHELELAQVVRALATAGIEADRQGLDSGAAVRRARPPPIWRHRRLRRTGRHRAARGTGRTGAARQRRLTAVWPSTAE